MEHLRTFHKVVPLVMKVKAFVGFWQERQPGNHLLRRSSVNVLIAVFLEILAKQKFANVCGGLQNVSLVVNLMGIHSNT